MSHAIRECERECRPVSWVHWLYDYRTNSYVLRVDSINVNY